MTRDGRLDPRALEALVRDGVEAALRRFALPCSFELRGRPPEGREPLRVVLRPGTSERLSPRRWTQVANALQQLAEAALAQAGYPETTVLVSLAEAPPGRPEPREDQGLVGAARALAEKASSLGRAFALGPMSLADRRLVHQALSDVAGVWTQSEGDGIFRRLWIVPRRMMPSRTAADAAPEKAPSPAPAPDAPAGSEGGPSGDSLA